MAVDSSGNVWVADEGNFRIQEFTSSGTFLQEFGTYGSGDGQFDDILCQRGGRFFGECLGPATVASKSSPAAGTFLQAFGTVGSGDGQIEQPS